MAAFNVIGNKFPITLKALRAKIALRRSGKCRSSAPTQTENPAEEDSFFTEVKSGGGVGA